ncbi:MAG: cupin domain-containing protein [Deltaproteobacteria bacterium]|nr:cupin domain-containing protein [Deltaproteobacteria bacterium]
MHLPHNVFRSTKDDWKASSWPAPFTVHNLEWRDHLPLRRLGGHLTTMPPGHRSGPLHAHAFEEEVFMVLQGTLTCRELVPGAATYRLFDIAAGELVVYTPGTWLAHGSENPYVDSVTYMGLSDDVPGEVATYPESGKVLVRALRSVGVLSDEPASKVIAACNRAAGDRDSKRIQKVDRPEHVAQNVPKNDFGKMVGRRLSAAAGAKRVMVNHDKLLPGGQTGRLHWHSAEEEIVFVLSGRPTLRQVRGITPPVADDGRPAGMPDFSNPIIQTTELKQGDVVCFGPHLPIAHHLRNESNAPCELLVIGLNDPHDVIVFPEQGRVYVKAVGRSGPLQRTKYFDGELPPPRD